LSRATAASDFLRVQGREEGSMLVPQIKKKRERIFGDFCPNTLIDDPNALGDVLISPLEVSL
jgi:hypothetical protein